MKALRSTGTSLRVTAALCFSISLLVPAVPALADGKDFGFEDMVEISLQDVVTGKSGGSLAYVHGPGELPALEAKLLPEIKEARLRFTTSQDLDGVQYLQFSLDAPLSTWVKPYLVETLESSEKWAPEIWYVYAPGTKRIIIPIDDFVPVGSAPDRPADLSKVTEIQLKIGIPAAGQYDFPGDEERKIVIHDLRLTEISIDIVSALALGPAELTLDATVDDGPLSRPWEGITGFASQERELREMGLKVTRVSALSTDDWEANDLMIQGVGQYNFEMIDAKYEGFDPEVEHMPWIPTIPFFLWQVQDPEILTDGGQNGRPKYAFMPPSDYGKWKEVVADFVRHHLDQGLNIRAFSILNESNSNSFWAGTKEEALEFYAETAEAVKSVDPMIKVAGPSDGLAVPSRMQSFLEYCDEFDVPVDYLTWHGYLRGKPGWMLADMAEMARRMMGQYPGRFTDTKLGTNEWGYALQPEFDERNRSPIAAAAMASAFKAMADAHYDIALWYASNAKLSPYHGSGLFDFDAISARPTLYAAELFNDLGETRVAATVDQSGTGVETLAAVDAEGVVRLITWWHLTGNGRESASKTISLSFKLPPSGGYSFERVVIDDSHGNLISGLGHVPLEPVDAGTVLGPTGSLQFDLPLYGVSMVTFTPLEDLPMSTRPLVGPPMRSAD